MREIFGSAEDMVANGDKDGTVAIIGVVMSAAVIVWRVRRKRKT